MTTEMGTGSLRLSVGVILSADFRPCHLGPFLVDSFPLVLMGDWNVTLSPKIDRGQGDSGRTSGDLSLVNLIGKFGFVERYRVDHSDENVDVGI